MYGFDLILSSLGSNNPAFTNFCTEILLSSSIKIIFLLYDQPSSNLATIFLTAPTSSHHEWFTINVDSQLIGAESQYVPSISNQNLIITVLNNWTLWKIKYYKDTIKYPEYANFLFVSNEKNLETDTIYRRLEAYHSAGLLLYQAVLIHLNASTINCYTLKNHFKKKHQLIVIESTNNRSIFDQLFWDRYKQMDTDKLTVTAAMQFPYMFIGKRRSKEMTGQYEHGVSGSFVYMTGLMADYLNATLDLMIPDMGGDYKYNKKTYQFNFTKVTNAYFVDDFVPLLSASKLQHQEAFMLMPISGLFQYGLYPHGNTDYVVIVPNYRIVDSNIWDVLKNSPLFSVWGFSIAVLTISRLITRCVNAPTNTSNSRIYIVFDTLGLTLGTTSATGVTGRSETIIVLFISVFAILFGIFISGFLIQQFAFTVSSPLIVTIDQVFAQLPNGDNSYDIVASTDIINLINFIEGSDYDDILDYQTSLDIDEFIIEQRRMAAYIVSDYHAELLLSQLKPVGDEQPIYRVLDIPIVTTFEKYFTQFWPIETPLNELLHRITQHGLYIYFEKRHRQIIGLKTESPSTGLDVAASFSSITLLELKFIIIVSAVGILLSVVAFVLELMLGNWRRMVGFARRFKRNGTNLKQFWKRS